VPKGALLDSVPPAGPSATLMRASLVGMRQALAHI
jgi:hypothetical protein